MKINTPKLFIMLFVMYDHKIYFVRTNRQELIQS